MSKLKLPNGKDKDYGDQVTITSTHSSEDSAPGSSVQNFEDLLKLCGEAGKWQLKIFLLASFCGAITALHNLAYAFIGAMPEYWCKLPEHSDLSMEELKNLTDSDGCKRCYVNGDWDSGNFSMKDVDCGREVECKAWDYDRSEFRSTMATEFDLVCGKAYTASLVQSFFMFGILVGSPLFGALSDRLGRRWTLMVSTVLFCAAAPLVAAAPNYSFMMFSRFLLGFAQPGVYATSYVLVVETIGLDWRGLAGNLFCLPFACGYMLLPLFAYFIRDWRELQYALSVPAALLLITWWFIPESPRWLLRTGKIARAEKILREMARTNGKEGGLPENFTDLCALVADTEKVDKKKLSLTERMTGVIKGYWYLLRSPRMRIRTLTIYFCWMSISMIYYGIALNSPNLSADRYLYTFIGGVLEVPSYFMVPPLIRLLGRRPVFSGLILITGVSLLSSLLFARGSVMVVTLALIGKLLIGSAYALVYLYATEVFPTLLRTYGLGTSSMVGRVGSVTAPFIVDLMGKENYTYPTIVFGAVALGAGTLALLLPETRNRRLPETVTDVEEK